MVLFILLSVGNIITIIVIEIMEKMSIPTIISTSDIPRLSCANFFIRISSPVNYLGLNATIPLSLYKLYSIFSLSETIPSIVMPISGYPLLKVPSPSITLLI